MGDEAFRELSKMDPEGSKLLDDVSLISKFISPSAQGGVLLSVYEEGPKHQGPVLTFRTVSF